MYITVRSILKEPVFEDAKVLSGKQFLENKVSRVSVFDCPFTPSVLEAGIIEAGDLFLSGLHQFADKNRNNSLNFYLCSQKQRAVHSLSQTSILP